MVDAVILSYTYNFLNSLRQRNFDLYQITLKYFDINFSYSNWFQYANWASFVSSYSNQLSIISDSKFKTLLNNINNTDSDEFQLIKLVFDKVCGSGPYLIVENIKLVNKNLPFDNSFIVKNVSNTITIKEQVKWDNRRNIFYENEVQRYKSFLYNYFIEYRTNLIKLKRFRDNNYVDYCYVDLDYVV